MVCHECSCFQGSALQKTSGAPGLQWTARRICTNLGVHGHFDRSPRPQVLALFTHKCNCAQEEDSKRLWYASILFIAKSLRRDAAGGPGDTPGINLTKILESFEIR